jgi:hypothetical protein
MRANVSSIIGGVITICERRMVAKRLCAFAPNSSQSNYQQDEPKADIRPQRTVLSLAGVLFVVSGHAVANAAVVAGDDDGFFV